MYELKDTIAAVSSPGTEKRVIVRVTGDKTGKIVGKFFDGGDGEFAGLKRGNLAIDEGLEVECFVYGFAGPRSYTGDDLAEFHFYSSEEMTEKFLENLFAAGCSLAGPGEFTARAYLNGKLDLSQAEAVGEIITGSNKYQIEAAEKLLSGKLSGSVAKVREDIIDLLAYVEAGMDFVEEDIEFLSAGEKAERAEQIVEELEEMLEGSLSYESVVGLPAVGLAGASNAGKSSLLNVMAKEKRSIVSDELKTTRDVLSQEVSFENNVCVMFDCAGLLYQPDNILDQLAQEAAVEALKNCLITVFCIDVTKEDLKEEIEIFRLVETEKIILAGTKCDLLNDKNRKENLKRIAGTFEKEVLPVSSVTKGGIENLKRVIDSNLTEMSLKMSGEGSENLQDRVGLTARHVNTIRRSLENVYEAKGHISEGNDELGAMLLRDCFESLGSIEQEKVDERILESIFGKFCIGK